jgi:hypothetical protein
VAVNVTLSPAQIVLSASDEEIEMEGVTEVVTFTFTGLEEGEVHPLSVTETV